MQNYLDSSYAPRSRSHRTPPHFLVFSPPHPFPTGDMEDEVFKKRRIDELRRRQRERQAKMNERRTAQWIEERVRPPPLPLPRPLVPYPSPAFLSFRLPRPSPLAVIGSMPGLMPR